MQAWNNKGHSLYHLGRYYEALVQFDEALLIDPEYVRAINNKGITLAQIGYYNEAIIYFDKALFIDPEYFKAFNNKGLTLYDIGKYEQSLTYFDKALEIEPENQERIQNRDKSLGLFKVVSSILNSNSIIPIWFTQNGDWFVNGNITKEEFVSGIEYLVEQGIIKV